MNNLFLIEDSKMKDIEKIKEYNEDFMKLNPKWLPFVTEDNFEEFIKEIEDKKQGIGNDGIKEIFYWFMEENKIIGSGSIRLNPEVDEYTEKICGHLFYQIIPSKRGNGYGTILCHLLLEKMKELGFKEALITCFDSNIGSIKIIENNGGEFIEYYIDENEENPEYRKNRRYKFNIEKSLENFKINNRKEKNKTVK